MTISEKPIDSYVATESDFEDYADKIVKRGVRPKSTSKSKDKNNANPKVGLDDLDQLTEPDEEDDEFMRALRRKPKPKVKPVPKKSWKNGEADDEPKKIRSLHPKFQAELDRYTDLIKLLELRQQSAVNREK